MSIDALYHRLYKLPIEQLPRQALPCVEKSTRIIALIPIFTDAYYRDTTVDAFIRSAIYSRWACYEYTDAAAQGIEVKFYIEAKLYPRLKPILVANHIDVKKDVEWFAAQSPKAAWGRLTKKMLPYPDARFASYDWIVTWDADVFFHRPGPHNIFKKVHSLTDDGALYYLRIDRFEWQWREKLAKATCRKPTSKDTFDYIPLQELFVHLGIRKTDLTGEVAKPLGGMALYPARHWHKQHQDRIWWMREYIPYLGDDEVCAMLLAHTFNFDIRCMKKEFNITLGQEPSNTLIHGKHRPPEIL